jgi:sarcosine oxidase gamma subunit
VDFSGTWTPAGKNAYLRQIKDINYSFAGVTAEEAEAIRQQLEAQKAQALSNANVAPEMDVRWAGPDAFLVIERGMQNAYRRAQ